MVLILDHWHVDLGGRKKILILVIDVLSYIFKRVIILDIETRIEQKDISLNTSQDSLPENVRLETFFLKKKSPRSYFSVMGAMLRRIKEEDPTYAVVGGAGPHTNAIFSAVFHRAASSRKVIAIEQGNDIQILSNQSFLIRLITQVLFRKIDRVVVVSKEMAERFPSFFHMEREKFVPIYNFIDVAMAQKLANEDVTEEVFKFGREIITTVCRIDLRQKDLLSLVRAFGLIKKQRGNIALTIIGDGPDMNILKNFVKSKKLEKDIFFLGYQKNPYKYMRRSDVFVLSSFNEGLPLVVLEAMACGCPIISSDCDFGPREILENGKDGILVPVGDVDALSSALLKMLSNKKLRDEYVQKGNERAKDFSMEKTSNEYEIMFKKALNSNIDL